MHVWPSLLPGTTDQLVNWLVPVSVSLITVVIKERETETNHFTNWFATPCAARHVYSSTVSILVFMINQIGSTTANAMIITDGYRSIHNSPNSLSSQLISVKIIVNWNIYSNLSPISCISTSNMIQDMILGVHHHNLDLMYYLIPDAVRGRYCTIRYSWNIMPVLNHFLFLADLPCADLFSIVSMLLCSCYVVGHC